MNSIREQYKFYIYHPSNGLVEVFPENSTLEWTWEKNKEKSQAFRRKTLSTELNFKKQDFTLLHDLERSNYKCEKIIIEVHRKCSGGFSLFWVGYLALIDGDYDLDKCIISIKPRLEDEYTCILKEWTKEKNIIGPVASVGDIKFISGTVVFTTCTFTYTSFGGQPILVVGEASDYPNVYNCLDDQSYWTFIRNKITDVSNYFNPSTGLQSYAVTVESKYAREVVITNNVGGNPVPPNGVGWIFLVSNGFSSTWVRPFLGGDNESFLVPIRNGRKLNSVIQYLIEGCGLIFVSDFFNKNPDNTNPTNFAYEYADKFYKDLVIWQKSDVKRQPRVITDSNGNTTTLPYQNATKALIKLKDLLNWMNTMYNVQWNIIGNQFRVEHYTYWNSEKQNLIDLTNNSRIKGFFKYKYEVEDLPKSEKWIWMEETDKSDFDGLPIIYDETCSYDEDENNDVEYPVNKVTTNIEYIVSSPSKISDDGFVIASTENSVIQSDICEITNRVKLNGPNALSNLLYYLHRHGRPQRIGNMNGTDETFYFPKPSRSQTEITFSICCEELQDFDTNYRIRTQLGWGEMDTVKFKDPNSLMTVKLLHE